MKVYLAGSLRNRMAIVTVADELQKQLGCHVFADWAATSPDADDNWQHYEKARGFSYKEALKRPAAQNVFLFDKRHIDESDVMVVAMPAGKSAFLELGYHIGKGKPGYILLEQETDRWDVMFNFADGVADTLSELVGMIKDKVRQSPFPNNVRNLPHMHAAMDYSPAVGIRSYKDYVAASCSPIVVHDRFHKAHLGVPEGVPKAIDEHWPEDKDYEI